MKFLVTGGSGFIGSHISELLLKEGFEVVIFDNLSRKGVESNIKWLKNNFNNIEFIKSDIRNYVEIKEAAKGCDAIFHTAAQVAVTDSVTNPKEDFEINALGTLNVLESARLNDCSVLFCSTNKVYGNNVNKIDLVENEKRYDFKEMQGIDENFPIDAKEHTPYGCSKLCSDQYVRDYSDVYGLKTIVNRMSCIYGKRQFGNTDQGWVVHFIKSILMNEEITIYGDGKQVRDVLFGNDVAKLYYEQYKNIKNKSGEVFNVGGGKENTMSLLELIEIIENMFKIKAKIKFSDWRPADQKVYYSNINKVKTNFKWQPETSPIDGIRKVSEWVLNK